MQTSVPPRRQDLPLPPTPLVGRERELTAVRRSLRPRGAVAASRGSGPSPAAARLLTLTGPPGIGKTRLALAAADGLAGAFADGVWLVELAALADPALVPQAVATAVGVQEAPEQPVLATLRRRPCARGACCCCWTTASTWWRPAPSWSTALLRACPRLTVLATSREALGIAGRAHLAGAAPGAAAAGRRRARPPGRRRSRRRSRPTSSRGTRRCGCSSRAPPRWRRASPSPRRTRRRWPRSAAGWTASRWRWSWRRRGCGRCRWRRSRRGWATASACSRPAAAPPCPATRRCGRRWTGATTSSPRRAAAVRAASRSSPAGSPWRRPRPSRGPSGPPASAGGGPAAGRRRRSACWTAWRTSSTSRSSGGGARRGAGAGGGAVPPAGDAPAVRGRAPGWPGGSRRGGRRARAPRRPLPGAGGGLPAAAAAGRAAGVARPARPRARQPAGGAALVARARPGGRRRGGRARAAARRGAGLALLVAAGPPHRGPGVAGALLALPPARPTLGRARALLALGQLSFSSPDRRSLTAWFAGERGARPRAGRHVDGRVRAREPRHRGGKRQP